MNVRGVFAPTVLEKDLIVFSEKGWILKILRNNPWWEVCTDGIHCACRVHDDKARRRHPRYNLCVQDNLSHSGSS